MDSAIVVFGNTTEDAPSGTDGVTASEHQNCKIVEATEIELFSLYLDREMDYIMDFNEYKYRMERAGCVIV